MIKRCGVRVGAELGSRHDRLGLNDELEAGSSLQLAGDQVETLHLNDGELEFFTTTNEPFTHVLREESLAILRTEGGQRIELREELNGGRILFRPIVLRLFPLRLSSTPAELDKALDLVKGQRIDDAFGHLQGAEQITHLQVVDVFVAGRVDLDDRRRSVPEDHPDELIVHPEFDDGFVKILSLGLDDADWNHGAPWSGTARITQRTKLLRSRSRLDSDPAPEGDSVLDILRARLGIGIEPRRTGVRVVTHDHVVVPGRSLPWAPTLEIARSEELLVE